MTEPPHDGIAAPGSKLALIWGATCVSKWLHAIGVNNWGDVAALTASVVSILIIIDWVQKRIKSHRQRKR